MTPSVKEITCHQSTGLQPCHDRNKTTRSQLLELPAELRSQIWRYTVVCMPRYSTSLNDEVKIPVCIDKWNLPLPPPITSVSRDIRTEALPLYYSGNIFECWRPWQTREFSLCVNWLKALGPEKRRLLSKLVLLYKRDEELGFDLEASLHQDGIALREGVVQVRKELTEYEMSYEALGLPKRFGPRPRR